MALHSLNQNNQIFNHQNGYDPPKSVKSDNSSFLKAVRAGDISRVQEFIHSHRVDVTACNNNGLNGLHLASKDGNMELVMLLLTSGCPVDSVSKKGNTPLHVASLAGQYEVVVTLLDHAANVNMQSHAGFTPLYMACQENHSEVVRLLLERGADPALPTEDNYTPMAVAVQQNNREVVEVLLEHEQRGKSRLSALHLAAKKDDVHAAVMLLQAESQVPLRVMMVNDTTKSGFTPLHIASHYGNLNVASILIQHGANVNAQAKSCISPLHVASKWGRFEVVQLLLDHHAKVDCITKDHLTPLHCSSRSGYEKVAELLLRHGAEICARTKHALTPLHMAAQGDHSNTGKLLVSYGAPLDAVTVDFLTPLHVAAHCGSYNCAKLLLDNNCQPDSKALNGFTALHIACKKNRLRVIDLLLQYGASVHAVTETGLTPLHVSSFMGYTEIVRLLLNRGADISTPTEKGETSLHLATRGNQLEVMSLLLDRGAQVDARAKEKQTALHSAARTGSVEAVALLLRRGASVDACTNDNYTPLHAACKEGHTPVIQLLLEHRADHSIKTVKSFTPLHIASKYGNSEAVQLLLSNGSDIEVESSNGLRPLHLAVHYDQPLVVKTLLQRRASPKATAKNGYTPLHIASKYNELDIATLLLDHKADPNAPSKNGFTPLHLSSQEGHTHMLQMLLSRKGKVTCESRNGLTCLHLAAQEDHVDVAQVLVAHQAPVDPKTKAGYTPLHTACHFGKLNMINFLIQHGAHLDAVTRTGHTPLHQGAQQGHVLVTQMLLKKGADPDALTKDGKTALWIAEQLGYISVVELLTDVTSVVCESQQDDRYDLTEPEAMHDAPMSDDDDDDKGDLLEQSYMYLSTNDDMRGFQDSNQDTYPRQQSQEDHATKHSHSQSQQFKPPREDDDVRHKTSDQFNQHLMTQRSLPQTQGQLDDVTYAREDANKEVKRGSPGGAGYLETPSVRVDNTTPDDEIKVTTRDLEKDYIEAQMQRLKAANVVRGTASHGIPCFKSNISETDSQVFGSTYSGMSYASSVDNAPLSRQPIFQGFLVSFMVDARGGAMRGCRHSGIRIIIPPSRAAMPTRVTCKLIKKDKLHQLPPLQESEALASRILLMGPAKAKFLGPVILEVPHFASLRGEEREIVVWRSENGQTWREHCDLASLDVLKKTLCGSFDDLESAEDLYHKRITRIISSDFPKYFALVTRLKQDVVTLGPQGGDIVSSNHPSVVASFPPGALTKSIKLALQVQKLSDEFVKRMVGGRVSVSPIATVEPRRRKFHRPINITLPLDPSLTGIERSPSLRLLCSMNDGSEMTEWEDITGTIPLSHHGSSVTFPIAVSARYWLINTPRYKEAVLIATPMYQEASLVPFMANFVVFAKRRDALDGQLRVFCMTDDKMDKTLEGQEKFVQVARSRDVEVLDERQQWLELSGNLIPVLKSHRADKQPYIHFRAFRENRLSLNVRVRDLSHQEAAVLSFMAESRDVRDQQAICTLNISLPSMHQQDQLNNNLPQPPISLSPEEEQISKTELRLTDIAECLDEDWVPLASLLNISPDDVSRIQSQYNYVPEQALVMLHLWMERSEEAASGNVLEEALRRMDRQDIIQKCIYFLQDVTDEQEIQQARHLITSSADKPPKMQQDENTHNITMESSLPSQPGGDEVRNFEEWVERREMKMDGTPRVQSQESKEEEVIGGDGEVRVEMEDDDHVLQDGRSVKRLIVTRSHMLMKGAEESPLGKRREVLVKVEVEEDVLELPPDFTEDMDSEEASTKTYVSNEEGVLRGEDGEVPFERRITRTVVQLKDQPTIHPIAYNTIKLPPSLQHLQVPHYSGDAASLKAQVLVDDAMHQALDFINHRLDDTIHVRVYTDTVEADPDVETDVQEFEEVLEDGSVVRRRVTKTKQKQTIIKRVVMEGPEEELPANEEEAQLLLKQVDEDDEAMLASLQKDENDGVVETEEVQEDGSVIKRRIVTSTQKQLNTEKIVLEGDLPVDPCECHGGVGRLYKGLQVYNGGQKPRLIV